MTASIHRSIKKYERWHNSVCSAGSERREVDRKLEELKKNRSVALGRQKGYEDEILRFRKELNENQYCRAEDIYRDKMIEMRTTELANKDLDIYYKALDQ